MKTLITSLLILISSAFYAQSVSLGPVLDLTETSESFFGAIIGFDNAINDRLAVGAEVSYTANTEKINNIDVDQTLFQITPQINYYFKEVQDGFHVGIEAGYANLRTKNGNSIFNNGRRYDGQFITGLPIGYIFNVSDKLNIDLSSGVSCYACLSSDALAIFPFDASLVYEFY